MISKDFINLCFLYSVTVLIFALFCNLLYIILTLFYGSQNFFKSNILLLFFKSIANLSLLFVCIIQLFSWFFFIDFNLKTANVSLFYDILSNKTQTFFYGKLYSNNIYTGLYAYYYSVDSFGLIIQFVGLFIGYLSFITLDTRFIYKNVKYSSIFCFFSVVIILYTTTNNFIFFFLFYELLLLPAFLLVYNLSQARRATQASLYFVIWTQIGSFLVLCATAYVIILTNSVNFSEIRLFKFTQYELYILFFLYFFGFGFKVPIWPFHYWLTKTHVEASAGFSMYLSGFLVKTALYGFYKYTAVLGAGVNTTLFIAIAGIGIVDASIKMFSQVDLKKLVAYCTIQEMNMIYLMLCWGDSTGCVSAMLFTVTHSFLSALMFYLVDCVQRRYNSRSTLEIAGLLHLTPNLGISIFTMVILYCGLPGTMKFVCEFIIFTQLIGVSFTFSVILLIFANFVGVVGFCRCWFNVLFGISPKYSKLNLVDLNFKEFFVIILCVFILIFLSYLPNFLF